MFKTETVLFDLQELLIEIEALSKPPAPLSCQFSFGVREDFLKMLHLSEKRKGEKRRIHKKQAIAWIFPSTSKQPIPMKKQRSRTLVLRFGEWLELFQAAKITRWP